MRTTINKNAVLGILAGTLALRMTSRLLFTKTLREAAVCITGGTRGLGLALALECARRGAAVAICGRDAGHLERAAQRLREFGGRVLPLTCDVRERAEIEEAILRAATTFGRLDVLINNAGSIAVGPIEAMSAQDYEDALKTHFWAMYYAVETARPIFERQGSGRITNITSIGGKISVPHLLPYCVSKFAAVGYSEGLRSALLRKKITVTTVVPGLMRTGSPRNAMFKAQHDKEYAWFMLSDSLPISSISASTAARAIVDATMRGEAEIVLSLPAKIAVLANAAAPGAVASAMHLASMILPDAGEGGAGAVPGRDSESAITQSPLTLLNRKAERDYNQI